MKLRKKLFCFIFALTFCAIFMVFVFVTPLNMEIITMAIFYMFQKDTQIMSKESQVVHSLLDRVSDQLTTQYNLKCHGTEVGMPEYVLNTLGLMFTCYRPLTVDEARLIAVDCVLELLNAANADEKVCALMKNRPFTVNNISITLVILNPDGRETYHPYLGDLSAYSSRIVYRTKKPNQDFGYETEREESFAEAQKILQEQAR